MKWLRVHEEEFNLNKHEISVVEAILLRAYHSIRSACSFTKSPTKTKKVIPLSIKIQLAEKLNVEVLDEVEEGEFLTPLPQKNSDRNDNM